MDVSADDPDLAQTVLTCEGDLKDPAFPIRLTQIICKLKRLVSDDKKPFQVTKVEPWNSVRVTFNIPRNAAQRLRQLAERGDNTLRELGILSVQIEGDQVITLTLTNSFAESGQQLVIGKSSDSVVNNNTSAVIAVNSSALNINNSDLTVNYNNVNSTASSVSPLVSSGDLIGSSSSGSNVEITRKNIAQYLSQQHIDVVNSTANQNNPSPSVDTINDRLSAFRSPNVVAPINTEPIPFLNSSSTTTVTSQLSTCVSSTASTCIVSSSAGNRLSAVTSIANSSLREIQSNYGLFPFASMQHSYQAMHTSARQGLNASHYTLNQRPNQVIAAPSVRLPSTLTSQSMPNTSNITPTASTVSSTISSVSIRPQESANVKVCRPVSSHSQQSAPIQTSQPQPAQAVNSASANVALTSPLLVNLLQSDATPGHLKGSTGQSSALTQINSSNDLPPKRKPRKTRKSKDKSEPEATQSPYFVNTSAIVAQTLPQSNAQTSVTTTSSTSSLKHLPSNQLTEQSSLDSQQMQIQSTFNISPHLISIPISAISRYPSIHPEAQGQPQVVRAGQLPLRSQISAPTVGSPSIATTHLRKPLFVTTSQASCSKPIPTPNKHSISLEEQKSSPNSNPNSANDKSVSSGTERNSENNTVFPSPPTSRMTGKTKHLINPFTGLLEPMLSDEEEEDRPSPTTLFPELDAGSDIGGNSERSVSDAGSNGKENNLSSDTDSGLGKSGTDVSSQSSIDVGNGDNIPNHLKASTSENISSNESIERLKLKVKIEAKTECPKVETSSNLLSHSRSHLIKQKSSETLNPFSTICGSTQPTDANSLVMAEPRVPPLHISIRGPNSAVVVSNRRESTSDIEMKSNVSKKTRAVRTTRAMSVESGLGSGMGTECTNNLNKNQRKKLQREQRFLSGGGIVTSNSSFCASPPSAESLIDINRTVKDLSFEMSSLPTTSSSESINPLFPQSDSSFAQNKAIDNNDNKYINNSKNISTKCVPLLNTDDSSQKCAIPETTEPSTKSRVFSSDVKIVDKTNSDLLSVANSVCVGLTPITSDPSEHNSDSSFPKPLAPTHQNESTPQTCNANNETPLLVSTPSQPLVSLTSSDDHKEMVNEIKDKSSNKLKLKSRKILAATLVTIEPLNASKSDPIVNKLSKIERINCISTPIPALINTRELNTSSLQSSQPTSIISTIEEECHEVIESNESNSSVFDINANLSQTVVFSEPQKPIDRNEDTNQLTKSEVVLNGDINRESIESPTNLSDSNNSKLNVENEFKTNVMKDRKEEELSHFVVSENSSKEVNKSNIESDFQSNPITITSEVQKQEPNNDSESGCNTTKAPKNAITSGSNQTVSEITAISDVCVKSESKSLKSTDSDTKESIPKENVSVVYKNDVKISKESICESNEHTIDTTCADQNVMNKNSNNSETLAAKCAVVDDTAKQPLQIVITTSVPSLTTTTSTAMFPHLKSSSLETGSRVTLITFKPNLNSPNNSSNTSGKTSHFCNSSLTSQMPSKGVPFKLLTIPSGSGGITVRSAANKLVELINSTNSSPVSPLSPNQIPSSGSPIPINTTSPPVRLLVSKVATAGGVTQAGVPVSAAGNSIGQLVVVKSVVVTNPSPSIKLVPAKSPSLNSSSLLIPVTRTNSPNESLNAINSNNNNIDQKTKQSIHSFNNISANNHIFEVEDEVQERDNTSDDNNCQQQEPVDLTIHCSESHSLSSSDDTKVEDNDIESVPRLIKSSMISENETLSDEEVNDDHHLTLSVASDHNYILKKSSEEFEDIEIEESALNLSNTSENENSDTLRDNDVLTEDDCRTSDHQNERMDRSRDSQSRPNKRKSSENAAELIKACMGVDDNLKKNSSFNCSTFTLLSGTRTPNMSTRTRNPSMDNDCINTTNNESSEANHLNKSKNLRIRKCKMSSSEQVFNLDNCSSDEEIEIKESTGISWGNRPRLRPGSAQKNQNLNKQKNCIKDSNNDKITNRLNDRTRKGRDRDQSRTSSTQRSTRRSRDHNIMITTTGINLHSSESSSESLHMEIVGLELSNDTNPNNCNNEASGASTTPPMIASSLLVKRKTRIGLNNNTEQSDASLAKQRRVVKENHR